MAKQKVLILSMVTPMSETQATDLKKQLQPDFPNHTIKVITGCMGAHEFEVDMPTPRPGEHGYV